MNKKISILLAGFAGLLALFGILGSLYIVMHRPLDPDMFHSVLVWDGVSNYGIGWLNDWRFTQDNWLFSLVPFQALLVNLTGDTANSILLSGWLFHILAVLVTALIAHQLGAVKSAPIIVAVLCLINVYGHWAGNISYPVSHNITNLIGLVTISLMLRWFNQPAVWLALLICLLQLLVGLSDPWLLPTYTLPAILALVALNLPIKNSPKIPGKLIWMLAASLALVFVLVKTRLWGTLNFMPVMHFAVGDKATITGNLDYLVRNIGGLFSFIYPLWNRDQNWPETHYPYAAISCVIVLATYVYCTARGILSDRRSEVRFFLIFTAFSVGGISLAYIISDVKASLASRFIINLVYLIPIVIAVVLEKSWQKLGKTFKGIAIVVIMSLAISGAVSHLSFMLYGGWPPSSKNVIDLIEVLQKNGLDYGYGPYHESKTNAVTVMSNGRIKIRPISFDQKTGRAIFFHPQTDVRWYKPEDAPSDQKDFFVYLRQDTAECANYNQCRKALITDFGVPQREIPYGNGSLMVWNHPLLGWGDDQPIEITYGKAIRFDDKELRPLWSGWTAAEPWGTWSIAPEAHTLFELPKTTAGDVRVRLESQAYASLIGLDQKVEVYANGKLVAELNYTPQSNLGVREWTLKKSDLDQGKLLNLEFRIRDPRSPKDRGLSSDTRKLGIGIVEITFEPVKN